MTCDEFWNQMPELAGEAEPPEHIQGCPSCAALLERQRALAAGLQRMGREYRPREASPAVEARLRAALRTQIGRRRSAPAYRWAWPSAAAVLVAGIGLTVGLRLEHSRASAPQMISAQAEVESADFDSNFIPLPFGSADSTGLEATEDADLVQVEVPRSALIALGLPVAEGGSPRVQAVLALGSDGTLQGIQIMQ